MDDLWAERKQRARAFLQDKPKRGHHWTERPYHYDREDAMYLGWFDDNPKKTATDKAKEAIAAYHQKFAETPTVILVNEADQHIELGGITIRVEGYIRRNNFWVGFERSAL